MDFLKIFTSIPEKTYEDKSIIDKLQRLIMTTDPTKTPTDISTEDIYKIILYVRTNNFDVSELNLFVNKVVKIPSTVGNMEYI